MNKAEVLYTKSFKVTVELKSSAGAEGQRLTPVCILLIMLFTQKGWLHTSTLQITLILHPTDQLNYGFRVSLVGF